MYNQEIPLILLGIEEEGIEATLKLKRNTNPKRVGTVLWACINK